MRFIRNVCLIIPLILILFAGSATNGSADVKVPQLKDRVNDYAGILSSQTVGRLDSTLRSLEQTDSTQIVVLTVPSLEGEPVENYSIKVAEEWKIGQKGLDNGAILLIAKNERKIRIETGYGLEGKLTDLISGQIIRNVIAPEFKSGNFDKGVTDGVDAMIKAVRGEFKATEKTTTSRKRHGNSMMPVIAFFVLVSVLNSFRSIFSAIAGGIALPLIAFLFFHAGLFLSLILIPVGIIAGLILSLISRSGFGGGYWGGGGGGGGIDIFSGGGGGFGGGGASGDW